LEGIKQAGKFFNLILISQVKTGHWSMVIKTALQLIQLMANDRKLMSDTTTCRAKFDELLTCVIIPTYNNATTLAGVIADVAEYTDHIIVVNDGSTDNTEAIVKAFPYVQYIGYTKNVGKGWALRQGITYALEQGYEYAITIDSDGQHFGKDLPVFMEKLETVKDAIIIGARNMDQASVPGKSSFGNKFSNFWFKVETGITMPDTQSGYRLYPLLILKGMRFVTRKYEFEIEVLVRAAWKGAKVISVPVTVYYAPKEKRISHFRPFKDFTRISILNTVLVLITFLYIKPRDFFRGLSKIKNWRGVIREHLFSPDQPDHIKALSVAFGVFMGIIPIWGFQLATAIFLAFLLRLNKALVIIAANISIPPMIPLIIFLSYKMGALWMPGSAVAFPFTRNISLDAIRHNLQQYIYGSITLAVVAGAVVGLLIFALLKITKRKPTPVS
jgi:glycosyltransferase involved in cell wall biosynthesis